MHLRQNRDSFANELMHTVTCKSLICGLGLWPSSLINSKNWSVSIAKTFAM